ncbi:MAG: hypothetical protein ACM3ST_12380 [Bdellovibrio bacteriovorus]
MPLQNRVTPWGEIVALPARGLFMGNRGCLHDQDRRVTKAWARLPWVTCLLDFQGRHRVLMAPGQYTELFFLDEATALAAGHRPCATCRRDDYRRFKDLWLAANPDLAARTDGTMASIDRLVHAERVDGTGQKRTWLAHLAELPDGTMVAPEGTRDMLLWRQGALHPWTPAGYGAPRLASAETRVRVLTPPSVVKALGHGYHPMIHPSVAALAQPARGRAGTPAPAPVRPVPATSLPGRAMSSGSEKLFYRLERTPAGQALHSYFAAILTVTGMDQGAIYPLKKFLKNFSGHEQAGRVVKVPGGYQLTCAGRDYFADRFRLGNPQHVDRAEAEALARLIRSGQAAGWVPVD